MTRSVRRLLPPPPPPVVDPNYSARAVLYMTGPDAEGEARFYIIGPDGKPLDGSTININDIVFESEFFENLTVGPDGTFYLSLKDGVLPADGSNIFDYITFTLDGHTYTMQVVVNQDGTYSPADAEANLPADGPLYGEWHSETEGTGGGVRESGDGHDEVWLHKNGTAMNGDGHISTGKGNDKVTVDGHLVASALGEENIIETGTGVDNISLTGVLQASGGGKNIIDAGKDRDGAAVDKVTVDGVLGAYNDNSTNKITSVDVDITHDFGGNNNYGIYATNSGGASTVTKNEIDAAGDVNIAFTQENDALSSSLMAMSGADGATAENLIKAGGKVDIEMKAGEDTTGYTAGLYAYTSTDGASARNIVEANGKVSVRVESGDGTAVGLLAVKNGDNGEVLNQITSQSGNIDIHAETKGNGSAYGMEAMYGAHNKLDAENGSVLVHAEGGITARGIYGESKGSSNIINAGKGITVEAVNSDRADGIWTNNESETILTTQQGDINVTAHANRYATGINGGTSTVLTAHEGNIKVDADANDVRATGVDGNVILNAKNGTVTVQAHSANGEARGLVAAGTSEVIVNAADVVVKATSEGGDATGIYTYDRASTAVKASGTVDVDAISGGAGNAYGIHSSYPSNMPTTTTVDAKNINITADATKSSGDAYGMLGDYGYNNINHHGNISENTLTATQDVNLIAKAGAGDAAGMMASDNRNIINAGGKVLVDASSQDGLSTGMGAKSRGENIINADDVHVSAVTGGNRSYAMQAEAGGQNTIQGTGSGPLQVVLDAETDNMNNAYAMHAQDKDSLNTIKGGAYNDSLTLNGSLYADNQAQNVIETGGGVDNISITGSISASGGGKNLINAGKDRDGTVVDKVAVDGTLAAAGAASENKITAVDVDIKNDLHTSYGLSAKNQTGSGLAKNQIDAAGDVDIAFTQSNGGATGLVAESRQLGGSAENRIDAGGKVDISIIAAKDNVGAITGLQANAVAGGSAKNIVDAEGNVTIHAESGQKGDARALYANANRDGSEALNELTSRQGNIVFESITNTEGTGYTGSNAMMALGGAKNILKAENGTITVNAIGKGGAMGIYAEQGSSNELLAGEGILVKAESSSTDDTFASMGVYANRDTEINMTTKAGDIDVIASSKNGGWSTGIQSANSNVVLNAMQGNIRVEADGKSGSSGLYANGNVSLYAENGTVDVISHSSGGEAIGVNVTSRALTDIKGDSVNIKAASDADSATAIYVGANGGKSEIVAAGAAIVSAESAGTGNAIGSHVTRAGNESAISKISGETIDVSATAHGSGDAYALLGDFYDHPNHNKSVAENSLSASGNVILNATANSGNATGLFVESYAKNTVEAGGSVKVTAESASGDATGMESSGFGSNTIISNDVSILADAGANAYGMYAGANGLNLIQGSGSGPITVTITATSGSMDDAYAMYAEGGGAINKILGSDQGDIVNINGSISASSGGQNIIDTGAGADFIYLNGAVGQGGLTILAGDGYDTLVLSAPDTDSFATYYEAWLSEVFTSNKFAGMSIEALSINIDGDMGSADLTWLLDYINQYNSQPGNNIDLEIFVNGNQVSADYFQSLAEQAQSQDDHSQSLSDHAQNQDEHDGSQQSAATHSAEQSLDSLGAMGSPELNSPASFGEVFDLYVKDNLISFAKMSGADRVEIPGLNSVVSDTAAAQENLFLRESAPDALAARSGNASAAHLGEDLTIGDVTYVNLSRHEDDNTLIMLQQGIAS